MNAKLFRQPIHADRDDPLDGLSRWLADCQVDEAAAARARQRSLERQAAQESTIAGVLLDLAERDRPVTVKTAGGRVCEGRITAVGADYVFLRDSDHGELLVPNRAIATVVGSPMSRPATGTRPRVSVTLADALEKLVADNADVVVAVGDECVSGRLQAAGTDVIAVAGDGSPRDLVHIATAAIDHLLVAR